jgi:hypothetical protein
VPIGVVRSDSLLTIAITGGRCRDDFAAEGACPARLQTYTDADVTVGVPARVPGRVRQLMKE